jgi:hypothetical protein
MKAIEIKSNWQLILANNAKESFTLMPNRTTNITVTV